MPGPTTIELHAISYSPVAAKRNDGIDYWARCLGGDQVTQPIHERFANYARRCHDNPRSALQEVQLNGTTGGTLRAALKKLQRLGEDETERREEITQQLANDLSTHMRASKANARSGALFVIQSKIDTKKHFTLVKLDLSQREVLALKEGEDHDLMHRTFKRALPESSDNLRKMIHYPSPGDGDARSGQFDAHADYWQKFIGAQPLREAKRASEAVLTAARTAVEDEGRDFTEDHASKIIDRASRLEAPNAQKLSKIVKEETGVAKRGSSIQKLIERRADDVPLVKLAPLKAYKYDFRGGFSVTVPAEMVKESIIEVRQEGEDSVIRIRRSTFQRTEQLGDAS